MALILIAKNITGDSQLWRADGTADYEDGAAVLLEKIVAAMKAAKV